MSKPFISVVMPTFNHGAYLERAINSVLQQKFQDWELLIVDDASTDSTQNIVKKYRKFPNIRYFRLRTNIGFMPARNVGIQHAHGEWLSFLDSDDEYLPDALERINQTIKTNSADIYHFMLVVKNAAGDERLVGYTPAKSNWQNYIPTYADVVFKHHIKSDMHRVIRNKIAKANPFAVNNPGLETAYYAHLAKLGYKFLYINQVVVRVNRLVSSHSQTRFQKYPLKYAQTYESFIKEHYAILNHSDQLFHLGILIAKLNYPKRIGKSIYWLAFSFWQQPMLFWRFFLKWASS